jgi:rfaE bifunctional protein nucleotidyltransferase chain/domain
MHTSEKIVTLPQLLEKVEQWKNEGLKIVFTNGCFDILHLGHVDYLEKAKSKGDILLIGVNTDASVRRLKGKDRPVNNGESRSKMLASLAFVDAVTLFAEDTPENLISMIVPHILVKGNDYALSNIVGADIVLSNGGKVETIDLVEGWSTTTLIKKIQNLN